MQQRGRRKIVILPKLKPDRQPEALLVVTACFGEIFFHGKPVLVGVEPHSMAWVLGEHAADRSASTWSEAMKDFDVLGQAVVDGGHGLTSEAASVEPALLMNFWGFSLPTTD